MDVVIRFPEDHLMVMDELSGMEIKVGPITFKVAEMDYDRERHPSLEFSLDRKTD